MDFILSLLRSMPGAISLGLIWGIMAIGVYITYKILDIADLTVDGSICTGACVCAVLTVNGVNVWVAVIAAVVAGMLTGLLTGFFHTVLGIPAILAGILTQLMLWSINLKILGKANLGINARAVKVIVTQLDKSKAIMALIGFVAVVILLLYLFFGTELGCSLRATGCNQNMSHAQGINNRFNKILGLILSNGLVALSGALLAQYQGFADINMGRGAIVIGLAAVIIGDAIFGHISVNFGVRLAGVALGGVIYYVVYQLVVWLGLDPELLKMLSALVVAVFLAIPYVKSTYFSYTAQFKAERKARKIAAKKAKKAAKKGGNN
ncbi:MAG: ABC transporter permease [Ruminococcaceae bacterium]|nr:ABC transporter permease [Oscillospiraceae bacterium]